MKRVPLLLAACMIAPLASAQVLNVPHFYAMTGGRPSTNDVPVDPNLTQMVVVQCADYPNEQPEGKADRYVTDILSRIASEELPSNKLCFVLNHYGVEPGTLSAAQEKLYFFRTSDTIPGISEGDFPFHEGYPRTDRPWRHPFGRNAYPHYAYPFSTTQDLAPLREWLERFFGQYYLAQQERISYNATHDPDLPLIPDPVTFRFDTETGIWWYADANCAYMLSRLALTSGLPPDSNGVLSDYWNAPFPGEPNGRSLAQMYADQVALRGWPADINDPVSGLRPLDIDQGGITADRNKPYTMWFATLCEYSKNRVMKNCAYEVIQQYWPEAHISNWDDTRLDHAIDATGWMMDWNAAGTARVPSNVFPRSALAGWDLATKVTPLNVDIGRLLGGSGVTGQGRWATLGRVGLASYNPTLPNFIENSPSLYSTSKYLHLGAGNYGWLGGPSGPGSQFCLQQPNLYVGADQGPNFQDPQRRIVLETQFETALRMARLYTESSIDSYGGGHSDKLVPWLEMAGTDQAYPTQFDHEVKDKDVRRMLSMLRGKNISDGMFWTGWRPGDPDPNDPHVNTERAIDTWKRTIKTIHEVYASRVSNYSGATSMPPYSVYPTGSDDLARLEFTLKDASGNPRTVDLASFDNHTATTPATYAYTSLQVDFSGLQDYATQVSTNQPLSGNGYQVIVEGRAAPIYPATNTNGVTTSIAAFNWKNNTWQWIRMVDPVEDDLPQAVPPRFSDSITAATWAPDGSFRVVCDLRAGVSGTGGPEYVAKNVGALAPDGTLRLLIVQRRALLAGQTGGGSPPNDQPWRFASTYDLVQVAPFPYIAPPPPAYPGPRFPGDFGPDYSTFYTSNPTLSGSATTVFDAPKLDAAGCAPVHYGDWHSVYDAEHWPSFCPDGRSPQTRNTWLLNSRFSLPATDANRQTATMRFTAPIWTDAPPLTDPSIQPYTVWLYFVFEQDGIQVWQWSDVTDFVNVQISRNPDSASSEVVISSDGTQPLPAGYYALVLNITRPQGDPAVTGEPYAVYCSGTLASPGPVPQSNASGYDSQGNIVPIVQYNFRLYPDCDDSGCIDTHPNLQCNMTGLTACPADLDDGSGVGVHDDGVDISDLLYFLMHFENGDFHADLDNDGDPAQGIPDGGVDINDLLYFLVHFERGC